MEIINHHLGRVFVNSEENCMHIKIHNPQDNETNVNTMRQIVNYLFEEEFVSKANFKVYQTFDEMSAVDENN